MGKIIAAEMERDHPGTGRDIGRLVGNEARPGDIIDFKDFLTTTNSFADEFIVTFLERHSFKELKTLKFLNASPLLTILLKRAIQRRVSERRKQIDPQFKGQLLCPAS